MIRCQSGTVGTCTTALEELENIFTSTPPANPETAAFVKQISHFSDAFSMRCEAYKTKNWNANSDSEQEQQIFDEIKGFIRDLVRILPLRAPRYAQEGRSATLNLLFEVQQDYVREVSRSLPNMASADQSENGTCVNSILKLMEICNNLLANTLE
jgi:hypothetical protein